jgi:hypothetical protein
MLIIILCAAGVEHILDRLMKKRQRAEANELCESN